MLPIILVVMDINTTFQKLYPFASFRCAEVGEWAYFTCWATGAGM